MLKLNRSQSQEYLLVWFFCIILIFGNAYLVLVNHDQNFAGDEKAYLALAQGSFDVNITFRYRVLIPWAARLLSLFFQQLNLLFNPSARPEYLPLGINFLIINTLIMATAGLVIYKITRYCGFSRLSCFIAVLAILTSGYCTYFTGVALADSLYFFSIVLLFYGIQSKNYVWLFASLILGPLAKESFWLFIPYILFFSRFIPFKYLTGQLLVAVLAFLALHIVVDALAGPAVNTRLNNILAYLNNLFILYPKIFSFSGLLKLGSTYGLFYLILLVGFRYKVYRHGLNKVSTPMVILFLLTIIIHVLLAGDIGRMWYFSAPVFALCVAQATEKLSSGQPWLRLDSSLKA